MSNFVVISENNGKCIVKCEVTPSQHVRDKPKNVWIALEKDGTILSGWCSCSAGTSATCNHIIAVLYNMHPKLVSLILHVLQCHVGGIQCSPKVF